MMNREKIIKKWTPVLENIFDYSNIETLNIVCIYAEWYSTKFADEIFNELPEKLKEIKEKIDKCDQLNRIEILSEFINPYSGLIQYKLSNGDFINKGKRLEFKFSSSEMLYIFGDDFVKYYSTEDYRDVRLNELGI